MANHFKNVKAAVEALEKDGYALTKTYGCIRTMKTADGKKEAIIVSERGEDNACYVSRKTDSSVLECMYQ